MITPTPGGYVCVNDIDYSPDMLGERAVVHHTDLDGRPTGVVRSGVIVGGSAFCAFVRVRMDDTGRNIYVHAAELFLPA